MITPRTTLILTPNERLASNLRETHDQAQSQASLKAWETLAVASWAKFLDYLWEEWLLTHPTGEAPPSLLNRWQERFLWMDILAASPESEGLLHLPAAAELAAEAHHLSLAFELDAALEAPSALWEQETVAFLGWRRSFAARCSRNGWAERARLEATLTTALIQGHLPIASLPSPLLLTGFTQLTPAQKRLLQTCRGLGVDVIDEDASYLTPGVSHVLEAPSSHWHQVMANDAQDELQLAARWIRSALERPFSQAPPRIGLVLPNLAENQAAVCRALDEALQPAQALELSSPTRELYDLSLGQPLARIPIILDALALLKLQDGFLALEDASVLFQSPFIRGGDEERSVRALLQAKLLQDGAYQTSFTTILKRAQKSAPDRSPAPWASPILACLLQDVLAYQRTLTSSSALHPPSKTRRTSFAPSTWSSHFKAILDLYGWPGDRPIDSAEFQAITAWDELSTHLGSLDAIIASLTYNQALSYLHRMADETIFQPQSPSSPIQVLGYLEAAGLHFDHLWIAGLDDSAWPTPSHPNPYLPISLQRHHQVPHSSAEHELRFCERLTAELLAGAPTGVVSYAQNQADQTLRPSPLIAHLPIRKPATLELAPATSLHHTFFSSGPTELLPDPGPPPYSSGSITHGGSQIFKLQSLCPFRAFATLRLYATPLPTVEPGLSPADRGQLLHTCLEEFWSRVQDHASLKNLTEHDRRLEVTKACDFAINQLRPHRAQVFTPAFEALEHQRLTQILGQWLDLEVQRPPFKVRSAELGIHVHFADIDLRVRVDRVDILNDGSLAVIDYKTGSVHTKDWQGERPADPQLPLYAIVSPQPPSVLAYAHLRLNNLRFSGLAQREGTLPNVPQAQASGPSESGWDEQLHSWRTILLRLAQEFRKGHAEVDPLNRPQTCQYCKLQPLCRIDEIEARS